MPRCALFVALSILAIAQAEEGDHAFEWAGIFETPDDTYYWGAEKVDGDYADPAMKIVLLPGSAADEDTLHGVEEDGEEALEGDCVDTTKDDTLVPAAGVCYKLIFDADSHLTLFKIDATGVSNIAFFAEHVPTEFERNSHYLKDVAGEDIEPMAELPEEEINRPWGTALGAAFVVNVMTLIGVIFIVPYFGGLAKKYPGTLSACVNAFAAGAILAAAFYLMFYEATHLIKPEGSGEGQQTALWGSFSLLGFMAAYFIHLITGAILGGGAPPATDTDTKVEEGKTDPDKISIEVAKLDPGRKLRVFSGIIVGDFLHNFVDGIFIATGFMLCDGTVGWTITAATIYHEIAQEISDYLVLTDPYQGNLKPWKALVFNFVSGMSVLLGAIVMLAQGEEDTLAMGLVLAFSGGVYVQIGAAECMPRAQENAKTTVMRVTAIAFFLLGTLLIGTVLFYHEHCAPDGGHAH